jgi:glycerophosphoryl diester phosphodiesterase
MGHLDLKEPGYEDEVIEMALAVLGPGQFVATSLEDSSIAAIKRSFPEVTTALSLGRNLDGVPWQRRPGIRASELLPVARLRSCGADWAAVNYQLAPFGVIGTCHRNGIGVMVWTVDSDKLLDQFLADRRVDVLITNRPRHALQRRDALSG